MPYPTSPPDHQVTPRPARVSDGAGLILEQTPTGGAEFVNTDGTEPFRPVFVTQGSVPRDGTGLIF